MDKLQLSAAAEVDANAVAACTIISKNYLPYARVLADSLAEHHPNLPLYVLLTDRIDGYFDHRREAFTLVTLEELDIPDLHRFSFQYSILELNTAAKPYFLARLLEKHGVNRLVYFDPDILILNNLSSLFALLQRYCIVITPHLVSPIEEDGLRPTETDILRAGAYNLGFIALTNTTTTHEFLSWWQNRVYSKCIVAFEEGLFVDQKWIDLVPGLFEGVHVLRAPGYNIAYWNLNSRRLEVNDSKVLVNGEQAFFFHFSGFDPKNMTPVSKYQNRFTIDKIGQEQALFKRYKRLLMAHGYEETKNWPYTFGRFDNGVRIHDLARRMYLRLGDEARRFGNPFSTNAPHSFYDWLSENVASASNSAFIIPRFWSEVYKQRPDLQKAYPDLKGADRPGFVEWMLTSGISEYDVDEHFIPAQPQYNGLNGTPKRGSLTRMYREWTRPLEPGVKRFVKKTIGRNEKLFGRIVASHRRLKGHPDALPISDPGVNLPNTDRGLLDATATVVRSSEPRPSRVSAGRRPFGVNLAGYVASEKGVGEALRSQARNLEAVGIPYVLNDFRDSGSLNQDFSYTDFSNDNPYAINVVQVNADQVPFFHQVRGQDYFSDRYNIGYWNWELSEFPAEWLSSFDYFDEIWVASTFVLDSVSRVSPIPVIRIPFSMLERPVIRIVNRSHFDLPGETFVFLFMFDFHSFLARKNPTGLIEAFKRVFPSGNEATLLLKCSHSSPDDLKQLHDAIGDANVRIIDGVLSRDEIDGLLQVSNCYVSLHRSEGFGLTIAEAMSIGKPVIATDYSGNVDFMTPGNSFPVKYGLTQIDSDYGPYKAGYTWAEPDLNHAADMMRFVFENRDQAREVGHRAQQDVSSLLHPKAVGAMIKQRLMRVSSLSAHPPATEKDSDLGMRNDQNLDVDQIVARIRDATQWRSAVIPGRSARSDAAQQPEFPDTEELLRQIGSGAAVANLINEIPIRSKGWKRGMEARVKKFLKHLVHWNTKAQADFNQSTVRSLNLVAQSLQGIQSRISTLEDQAQSKESRLSQAECSTRDLQQQVSREIDQLGKSLEEIKTQAATASETLSRDSFDYLAFEDRFRGNRELIRQRQAVYLEFFVNRKKVVDLGCGRGEFVELLYENGIDGVGVDSNEVVIQFCRSQGLRVVRADLFDYLTSLTDESIDGITAFQVVEHLPLEQLLKLLELSRNKLKHGGVFIAETVNIYCPVALSHFYIDPSHIRPLPADLLRFLCEQAGFEIDALRFSSPASGENTSKSIDVLIPDLPPEVSHYSDYSVIAVKPKT